MRINSTARGACAVLLALSCGVVQADVDPRTELDKKIKVAQVIDVLGPDLVGDSSSLYTGSTSFSATDVSVPGNNALAVAVGRTFSVQLGGDQAANGTGAVPFLRAFGDWDLDVPYLSGVYSHQLGWEINSTTPTKRCSVMAQVKASGAAATGEPRSYPINFPKWWATEFWNGIDMNIPGLGKQSLLLADQAGVPRPTTGGPYHWTTKADWWFSCLDETTPATGGEAFVGHGPNGEKYTFNRMSTRYVAKLSDMICPYEDVPGRTEVGVRHTLPAVDGAPADDILANQCEIRKLVRREFFLLATRVEDRFGNWVSYAYSDDEFARLLTVSSSDGRQITLSYNAQGYVSAISDGSHTWSYQYAGASLGRVVLPDGSSWQYGLADLGKVGTSVLTCDQIGEPRWCYAPPVISNLATGWVVHPSGARVDFVATTHFKAGAASWAAYPVGLISKTISGPGLTPATWSYSFLPTRDSYLAACKTPSGCPGQLTVDTAAPDGSVVRSTFGTNAELDQGMLLSEQAGSVVNGTAVYLKESITGYATLAGSYGFVTLRGTNPMSQGDGLAQDEIFYSERKLPVQRRQTSLQGVSFTWEAESFDQFAVPARVRRYSSLGFTQSRATSYLHALDSWVIGQVSSITDVVTGKIISGTDFLPGSFLPSANYNFGIVANRFSYNFDGTLASVTDGRSNVTRLADWYRGVPRSLAFADGTTQSAVVGPTGLIYSAVDQLGRRTGYGYDPMGRMSGIVYPAGDPVAWNGTDRSFISVPFAEYGLAAGHWKQTVATGNGSVTTYFDARWQPVLTMSEDASNAASKSFTVRRFDVMGREVFISYPVGSLTSVLDPLEGSATDFDALGRSWRQRQDSELGVLVSSTEYLPGFKTRRTNPRGFQTTTSYQAYDTPQTDLPVLIEAPEGATTTILRDGFGKPTKITRSTSPLQP